MEKQKWILVTGADRGLGLAFCEEFLNRGYYVIGAGHREDSPALEELRKQWGEKMCPIVLDVASCASVAHSVEQVRKYTDALWLLVNNAGMGNHGPDIRKGVCPEDNWRMFQVNALGACWITEAYLPMLRKGGKRLAYISSEAGSVAVAHREDTFGYCMSKTALNRAVRVYHNRLAPEGFRVYLYHPGWLKTMMMGAEAEGTLPPEKSAQIAADYFLEEEGRRDCLVIRDWEGRIWPF